MSYYTVTGNPVVLTRATTPAIRAEFLLIQAAFALLPVPAVIFGGYSNYYVATGTASAFAITVSANVTTIPDGTTFLVNAPATNNGALTIAISYSPVPTLIGTYTVGRPDGTALAAGDWVAGQTGQITFSTASGKFQLAPNASAAVTAAAASAAAALASQTATAASQSSATASASAAAASAVAAAASAATLVVPTNLFVYLNYGGF